MVRIIHDMALEWGYGQQNGPETWPKKYPEAAGKRQSPVDIKPVDLKAVTTGDKLCWKYIAENTEEITNTGYCWKVRVNGKGSVLCGGPLEDKFILEQFHCHWGKHNDEGSEHTINGQKFAGELHLVHWNATRYKSFSEAAKYPDGLCVLGVFLKPGKKHHELEKIVSLLSKIEFRGQYTKINEPINPSHFLPEDSGYYTYLGSLTTPPCSECVIWIIFKEPVEVSKAQLVAFRNLKSHLAEQSCPTDEFKGYMKSNFRPTLPLGQREIRECRQ